MGFPNVNREQKDQTSLHSSLNFEGPRLSLCKSGQTADHYFWCSGGVSGCFERFPGYYAMFQGCSGVVPGCSGVSRGCFGFYRHPICEHNSNNLILVPRATRLFLNYVSCSSGNGQKFIYFDWLIQTVCAITLKFFGFYA